MITRRQSIYLMGASALALSTASRARADDVPHPMPADWGDPMFAEPFVDIDEWRDTPVRHRYVHGGFKGTDALFSMYFPPKEQYQGRFFQPIAATSGDENGRADIRRRAGQCRNYAMRTPRSALPLASGGYLVESNLGSKTMYPLPDHTIEGYRASAAVAKHSRMLAAQMYGPHRPMATAYGGSGGGYKTVSLAQSTRRHLGRRRCPT